MKRARRTSTKNKEDLAETAAEWYAANRRDYQALAGKAETLIREILEAADVEYHSITSRAKPVESFRAKASSGKYRDPKQEIKDMAGVRIITYVDADAKRAAEIVQWSFDIDPEHSVDKSAELGVDRVGYRSLHFVAKFSPERCNLPEYRRFEGMDFEVQVRTILQHAWAEIEHDRNYKFTGVLPAEIQRRFSVLAGALELADREIDQIAAAIGSYSTQVAQQAETGNLDIEVNTTSLREYLWRKFRRAIEGGELAPFFGPEDRDSTEAVKELQDFGLSRLSDLDQIIPGDLGQKLLELATAGENFIGLVRAVLMIHDADLYFTKAWKEHWGGLGGDTKLLRAYGVDVESLARKYGIDVPKGD
ncbi:MAG: hypothetical protein WBF66_08595 [Dehalococcoidia bacterium]